MIGKALKYGTQSVLMVVLMVVILAMINLFAQRPALRVQFDLTEDRVHTIPEASLNVVRNLGDVINVTIYLSENLPPRLQAAERQLRDKLAVYADAAEGNLAIEYIDPMKQGADKKGGEIMNPLRLKGVNPVDIQILQRGKFENVRIYMAIEIQYGEKNEVLPTIFTISNAAAQLIPDFEYAFTAALKKVSQPRDYRIGFATTQPGLDIAERYAASIKALRERFTVYDNVRLSGDRPIQGNLDCLVLVAPHEMTPAQLFQIDQFVMNGGRLIALVDRVKRQEKSLVSEGFLDTALVDLLAHWGVTVNRDMALDPRYNVPFMFSSGQSGSRKFINYPDWVRAPREMLDREHPVVNRLPGLAFPWTSTLTLGEPGDGWEVTPLVRSSPVTWVETEEPDLSPAIKPPSDRDRYTSRVLAAAVSGRLPSYFADRPLDDVFTSGPVNFDLENRPRESRIETQIIVTGDADFLSDGFLGLNVPLAGRPFAANYPFLANAVDWMTIGGDLIGIRARGAGVRPLRPNLTDDDKTSWRRTNLALAPILLLILGAIVFSARRFHRRRLAERYRPTS